MKKNLLFLFALICSIGLFTACNNDDEKVTLQDLSKEYSGENLALTVDGSVASGKTVKFIATSAEAATLALIDVVSEIGNVTIDLNLKAATEVDGYAFEGSKEISGYVISVSGTLSNSSKLTVNVLTKGWELEKKEYTAESLDLAINGKKVADQSVTFNITSNTEANVVFKNVFEGYTEDFVVPVKMIIAATRADVLSYTFKGEAEPTPGYVGIVSGTVSTDGKMTLNAELGGWKTFKESYSYTDKNLVFVGGPTNNDAQTSFARTINLEVVPESNGEKATLIFNGDFISELEIMDLGSMEVTLTREGTVYKISGEKAYNDFLTFVAEGTVTGDTLNLTVSTPKYTQLKKDLVGTWNLNSVEGQADTSFKFATHSGSLIVPAEIANLLPTNIPGISEIIDKPIPDATINVLVGSLLSQYALNLKTIEFTENANNKYFDINITYSKEGSTTIEELKGLLHYNWTKEGLYIGFDLSKVMGLLSAPTQPASRAAASVDLLGDGIPFQCHIIDGNLTLSIDKETVKGTVAYINSYVIMLDGFMSYPPEVLASVLASMFNISNEQALAITQPLIDIMPTLKTVLPAVNTLLTDEVETLDAGLSFVK